VLRTTPRICAQLFFYFFFLDNPMATRPNPS
jgi:hypothetical protein